MSGSSCNTTSDCAVIDPSASLHCYKNPIFFDGDSVCDCSVFFGWTGEGCSDISPFLLFQRVVMILVILLSSFGALISGRIVILNYLYDGCSTSLVSIASYSVCFAFICFTLTFSFASQAFFNSNAFKLNALFLNAFQNSEKLFIPKNEILIYVFGSLAVVSVVGASTFLILSWHEIVINISIHSSFKDGIKEKVINRFWKIVLILSLAGAFVIVQLSNVYAINTFMILVLTLIVFLLIFFSNRFTQRIKQISPLHEKDETIETMISFVLKVTKYLVIIIILNFTATIVFVSTFFTAHEKVAPGDFSVAMVAADCILLFILLYLLVISWYINSISVGPIVSEEYFPKLCYCFSGWDRMNRVIIPEDRQVSTFRSDTIHSANMFIIHKST